ncbi:MAG: PIN domain-containing protein [Verrucomicrobiota bacterium]|nr:PIN domain-containing protein [Verrucomicrobiota bacterium]
MKADFQVVLDACILANFSICDLFLRLAETPRLYLPRWSEEILVETHRTHIGKLGWPADIAESFQRALREQFPEAMVTKYEPLIDQCTNDIKDRHVLASAIRCQAEIICTFNLKDFPSHALQPWGITACHPQDYLLTLYAIDRVLVVRKIEAIARKRGIEAEDHLIQLGRFVPSFSQRLLDDMGV